MSDYHKRKKERIHHYNNNVKGWKLRDCTACSGSGYYIGKPCGACDGSGKERYNSLIKT